MLNQKQTRQIRSRYTSVSMYELKFPCDRDEFNRYVSGESNQLSGDTIIFRTPTDVHITNNPLHIEFASLQANFLCVDELDEDTIVQVFRDPSAFPHVSQSMTKEEALEFVFSDPRDNQVLDNLLKYGYITKEEYDEKRHHANRKKPQPPIKKLSDEDLIAELKLRGYVGARKAISKKKVKPKKDVIDDLNNL